MEKVATIKELYFDKQMSLTEISEIVKTSISYISRILRNDKRYNIEKEKRKKDKLMKRKKLQKALIYKKRKEKNDIEYINMKNKHNQAVKELSKKSVLGKDTLRKWCSSAYKYNNKKNIYEFDTESLLKPADFPLYIKA